jgi:hypothetical protein
MIDELRVRPPGYPPVLGLSGLSVLRLSPILCSLDNLLLYLVMFTQKGAILDILILRVLTDIGLSVENSEGDSHAISIFRALAGLFTVRTPRSAVALPRFMSDVRRSSSG